MGMPTLKDALEYMGIDYADAQVSANVQRALSGAAGILRGAVGEDAGKYLGDDPRLHQLALAYTDELYSDRGVGAKAKSATRQLIADMELQLRLELRRLREEADA